MPFHHVHVLHLTRKTCSFEGDKFAFLVTYRLRSHDTHVVAKAIIIESIIIQMDAIISQITLNKGNYRIIACLMGPIIS